MDVTTKSFANSVRALRTAQKSNRGAPIYSRLVNRPVGRVFAALAHQVGLTPNQVTGVSAIFTFTAIVLVALVPPSPAAAATVALLLMIGYGLDAADGQLARLLGSGSPAGGWLDHVCDSAKTATIHLAVLVSMYRFADLPTDLLLLVPICYSIVDSVLFFGFILTDSLRRPSGPALAQAENARPSVLRSVLAAPTDYGILCLIFFAFAWPQVFLVPYGILMLGTAGYLLLALPRWYRDISRLGSPVPGTR
ncbi:CDP-alcohol phosphatidyltransferase family protein [Georgenia subflava]|uniref:CDP-alcohol phosphatidyltransferase n=1 Tax=Georgenia subflava TaxID=1622177 RepID=A0A6N7EIL9_9MICO|nr:CDP-alcohol phosphatidyltransferase family protein [Georgenia subflava]MPV36577.1 CDP-alcohol phosphatidyltransferase [Georgenia subflava]